MALIKSVRGFDPQFGKDCYLAENATVVGDVIMGDGCSVWFNAVLRGDVNSIRIGNHVNIQDGSVLHTSDLQIENGDYLRISNVTIGYDFKKIFKSSPLEQMRLYFAVQNLYTFTKYSGMDPEIGTSTDDTNFGWTKGIDLGFYPSPRTCLIGLSLKF